MNVSIIKHTGLSEARRAIESTMRSGFESKANLDMLYRWMHSPIRTQIFEVILRDIPSFVSVHLVRHVTTTPYVTSNRTDRGGTGEEDRYTPVDHTFWCNAEALISMSNKRLCYQASQETRRVMWKIKNEMREVDPDLERYLVPMCVFRGGYCCEPKPCGMFKNVKVYNPDEIWRSLQND